MKKLTSILTLGLLSFAACGRPVFEATVTAYTSQTSWEQRNAVLSIGVLSYPELMELRRHLHADEFWDQYSLRNPEKTEREIRRTRKGFLAPTRRIYREGNNFIEEYAVRFESGDQATFDSIISCYRDYRDQQAIEFIKEAKSRKESSHLFLASVEAELLNLRVNSGAKPESDRVEILEYSMREHRERIARLNSQLHELEKVGKIVSIHTGQAH